MRSCARAPQVVLVDELAHTNVPGSRNAKRCEDVEELLAAGITVISTLNIQHLESVNDVVEQITGVKQRETIPDAIVRRADQVELVDMAPEAIRRRMAHGNIYPPERVDAALGNYFRPGNLAALRELALLWVADRVEEGLADYRDRHGIDRPWETRERILVAITGSADGDRLIRRGARMAARAHGELIAVHVTSLNGEPQGSRGGARAPEAAGRGARGTVKDVAGDDVGETLVADREVAQRHPDRARLDAALTLCAADARIGDQPGDPSLGNRDRRPRDQPGGERRADRARRDGGAASRRCRATEGGDGVRCGRRRLPLLTLLIAQLRAHLGLPSILLLYLLAVVLISAVGGLWPALAAALAGFLLANWYLHASGAHVHDLRRRQLRRADRVPRRGAVVSGFVALASRRAAEGARARAESEALVRLGGSSSVPTLLETLRRALGLRSVALLHRGGYRLGDRRRSAGTRDRTRAGRTQRIIPLDEVHELHLFGGIGRRAGSADSRRVRRRDRHRDRRSRSSRRRCARSARSWLRGMRVRRSSSSTGRGHAGDRRPAAAGRRGRRGARTLWRPPQQRAGSRCSAGISSISAGSRVASSSVAVEDVSVGDVLAAASP